MAALFSLNGLQAQELKNYQDSLSYAVGVLWGQNIKQQGLEVDATRVGQAIGDVLSGGNNLLDIKAAKTHWIITWSLEESENYDRFGMEDGRGWMAATILVRMDTVHTGVGPVGAGSGRNTMCI